MTKDQFLNQCHRLELLLKPLSREQRLAVYEEVKHLDPYCFEKAVGRILDTMLFPVFPTIAEIKEAYAAAFVQYGPKPPEEEAACETCHGSGWELVNSEAYMAPVARPCHCAVGRRRHEALIKAQRPADTKEESDGRDQGRAGGPGTQTARRG